VPWFAVDDGFFSHPKVRKVGNPAAGLFCRLGAYSARHSTDGMIDGITARAMGTGAQLAKLTAVGMLHTAGHDCPHEKCQQPPEGDYFMHDFLDYNRSREQVTAAREAGRKRQQRGRDTQKAAAGSTKPNLTRAPGDTPPEPRVNLGWAPGDTPPEVLFDDSTAGHEGTSRRYTLEGATAVPSQPLPSPAFPNGNARAAAGGVTDALAELKRGIAAAGLQGIGWELRASQWEYTRQAIESVGVPAMVAYAVNSSRLKGIPATAGAWVQGWRSLEPVPEQPPGAEVAYLPAAVGADVLPLPPLMTRQQREQAATDDMFAAAMDRANARAQEA
jgi:hypothetical protein